MSKSDKIYKSIKTAVISMATVISGTDGVSAGMLDVLQLASYVILSTRWAAILISSQGKEYREIKLLGRITEQICFKGTTQTQVNITVNSLIGISPWNSLSGLQKEVQRC